MIGAEVSSSRRSRRGGRKGTPKAVGRRAGELSGALRTDKECCRLKQAVFLLVMHLLGLCM